MQDLHKSAEAAGMSGQREEKSEQDVQDLRYVLAHLYDYGALRDHTLVRRLAGGRFESSDLTVQYARGEILRAVERLRPPSHVSPRDRQWRPYDALYKRYVMGMPLEQIAAEMSLSTRQVQREQGRGLEAMATDLDLAIAGYDEESEQGTSALYTEIARAHLVGTFDCVEHALRAASTAGPLLEAYGISFDSSLGSRSVPVQGDARAFRQMLISTFSHCARILPGARVDISRGAEDKYASVMLTVEDPNVVCALGDLPVEVSAIARSQGWRVIAEHHLGSWRTSFLLPRARGMPLVALVEDNDDLVALLQRYLSQRGYGLVAIGDTPQALDEIRSLMPDIVVLDVMMRHVDGWELLQRLGSDLQLREIPKIVCSVLNEPEMAKHLGASAFLRKPIRPLDFLECLKQVARDSHSGPEGAPPRPQPRQ